MSDTAQTAPRLATLQRWMQAVVMHPGGVREGITSPAARAHRHVSLEGLGEVVLRSRALSSAARLEIYVDAYFSRLLECLREEYPTVAHAVGDETFQGLAFGYLQRHPSQSYTLHHLGARFAAFLDETRLHRAAAPAERPTWCEFVVELALFERALREVFDGPGIERQPPFDPSHAGPEVDRLLDARFAFSPCVRLLRFGHPIHQYFKAVQRERQPDAPLAGESYLLLTRVDYRVRRVDLSPTQYALLAALATGATLRECFEAAAATPDGGGEALSSSLRGWFAEWAMLRIFIGVAPRP